MEFKKLRRRFYKQEEFASGYAPLYARLFGLLAKWADGGVSDPVMSWLMDVGNGRSAFDIPLLLVAALHRDVLMDISEAAKLATYYPTVGGSADWQSPKFETTLREIMLARRDAFTPFIQTATVQTNETGRGLVWILPLLLTRWEAVHLVDLGASAGLNLVADQRAFRLVDEDIQTIADLGKGTPPQFQTICQNWSQHSPLTTHHFPQILSRTGCDIAPFGLETAVSEHTLASFIWADHPPRLTRLREGITAFRQVSQSDAPVQLHQTTLPDGLPQFLQKVPQTSDPVLIYNTYMTVYLPDKGISMWSHINEWALQQNRPVLWLQWEPLWGGPHPAPPEFGWCAWMVDWWQAGQHKQWQFAWVHPHGTKAQFLLPMQQKFNL
ncbi:MAG: DUF2332 domain-containing protein [Chloroflexi bacterium]|nr:MAG: DUF2332 domain-containing protein [Chloroflexota bacterium]